MRITSILKIFYCISHTFFLKKNYDYLMDWKSYRRPKTLERNQNKIQFQGCIRTGKKNIGHKICLFLDLWLLKIIIGHKIYQLSKLWIFVLDWKRSQFFSFVTSCWKIYIFKNLQTKSPKNPIFIAEFRLVKIIIGHKIYQFPFLEPLSFRIREFFEES
jgi:xanthosine utilization system XapX-like protein